MMVYKLKVNNMKHFTKLFIGILFLILGGTQSGFAQTIDDMLLEKAVDPADVAGQKDADGNPVYVYLYNVTNKKFVHGGGEFGAQAVLSDRGIRFEVTKITDGVYSLESAIYNQSHGGGYLGVDTWNPGDARNAFKTYIDRGTGDGKSDIRFTQVAGKSNIYQLSYSGDGNRTYWYTHYDGGDGVGYVHVVDSRLRPDEWCLIKRDDYNAILADVAQQGRYNITGLIGNSRFLRNVSDRDNKFWSVTNLDYDTDDYCTTIDPHLGAIQQNEEGFQNSDDYARAYGAFGCLEIGAVTASEDSPVEFFQEITGLKPGLYMVEAQAFFDKNDYKTYKNGAYNEDNTTDASNAYLFANGAETLIPVLNDEDQTTFDGYVSDFKEALDYDYWTDDFPSQHIVGTNNQYFRRNVAAAYFLAQGNAYEPDESNYRVRVYVNVTDDGSGTGTLKLGVNKKGKEGRVYVDNFGLYYVGDNAIGLDAYQRNVDAVDHNKYQQSYTFHLSRKFVLSEPENDKWNWNAITLPMDVSGSQITETFGEDAKLCKLEGVNPLNKDQILFTPVDLTDYSKPAIERGGCYLICVTNAPDPESEYGEGKEYSFIVKSEGDAVGSKDMVFPYGNIYNIEGVSCPEGMVTPDNSTVEVTGGKLSYTYFYHRPEYAPAGSYVMSGGKMYHIPNNWPGLLGTCWYITDLSQDGKTLQLMVNGEGGTTDINGIVTELPGDNAHEGVYNINGQKVADGTSLKNLPKGIYIMNGKKYVIK
jgi:hypothetical protein